MEPRSRSGLRRALALVLACNLLVGVSAIFHLGGDDAACQALTTTHDPASHRVEAADPASKLWLDHCVACHWLQTFRPLSAAGRRVSLEARCVGLLDAIGLAVHSRLAIPRLPARAPPA